ncbi:uncharacterized protein At1g66480-like isoform X2 [Amaranthus tricolor]|uniref:uncharacterized protein At1g66480-like isoform X2 n=1 Tax=Amaranthus tricolor TaxID=29722 RepID=UPI00258B298F|nr:uncharacterized protein At1g66480-like isoform X2 [Amaranthus tricolor]
MGNTLGLGGKKTAKIMKINGETIKFKTPIQAKEVVKDYPGHVVLDSDSVKHYGIRAKPLEPFQNLEPKRLYFLVELPKFPNDHHHRTPRRVRSGIHMSAKDRLESLMLSRRSVSDLSIMGPATRVVVDGFGSGSGSGSQEISDGGVNSSGLRVRMKLPKAEVEKLMNQNMDEDEVASKIVDLCLRKNGQNSMNSNGNGNGNGNGKGKELHTNNVMLDQPFVRGNTGGYNKRVGFSIREGEMGVVAS